MYLFWLLQKKKKKKEKKIETLQNSLLEFQVILAVVAIVLHYLVPCIIITVCYVSICRHLNRRPEMLSDARQKILENRRKRNNRMLILVALTHYLSWLPLNVINLVIYAFDTDESPLFQSEEQLRVAYGICHLISMSSAITNPVLYGFMNENFRREFFNISKQMKKVFWKFLSRQPNVENNNGENANFPLQSIEQMATYNAETEPATNPLRTVDVVI